MRTLTKAASAVTLALSLAMAPTMAMADHNPQVTKPGAVLELSYTTASDFTYSVDLTCLPAGGTHSNPWAACWVLQQAGGDFSSITPWDQACTDEYAPVTLSARGHWLGEKVRWVETFGNACEAQAATAGVFDF